MKKIRKVLCGTQSCILIGCKLIVSDNRDALVGDDIY